MNFVGGFSYSPEPVEDCRKTHHLLSCYQTSSPFDLRPMKPGVLRERVAQMESRNEAGSSGAASRVPLHRRFFGARRCFSTRVIKFPHRLRCVFAQKTSNTAFQGSLSAGYPQAPAGGVSPVEATSLNNNCLTVRIFLVYQRLTEQKVRGFDNALTQR